MSRSLVLVMLLGLASWVRADGPPPWADHAPRGTGLAQREAPPLAVGEGPAAIAIELSCGACTETDEITALLLWQSPDPARARSETAVLRTLDWAAGDFELSQRGDAVAIEPEPVDDGWLLRLPLTERGLPDRVHVFGEGLVADAGVAWPAARWPAAGTSRMVVHLEPQGQVLERHPEWDPARSDECDLIVPKGLEAPIALFVGERPRAWLVSSPRGGDEGWRFQFVQPGRTLLERIEVPVEPSDEGDAWGFHVPLQPLLAGALADAVAAGGGQGPWAGVRLAGVGKVALEQCPRRVVEP